MPLKPANKTKIAIAAVLLVILSLGALIIYLQFPADSQPEPTPPPVPATTTAPAPPKPTFRQFLRVVQSDDMQKATEMLTNDSSLAKQARANDGATALHLAISIPMAKLLLDNGADISAHKNANSGTPLRWAASRLWDRKPQSRDVVRFIQSKGAAEPDIYFAAVVGDIPQMEKLLAADPSLIDKPARNENVLYDNCAPLQMAAYADQFDSAKFLIDHGASARARNGWHNTEAMEKAAWIGSADIITLLLDHGGSVNSPDNIFNNSPLQNAATMGHADIVKILLAHGATFPRKLISQVRTAMQHPDNEGPTPGSQDDFKQVLDMLNATIATQPSIH